MKKLISMILSCILLMVTASINVSAGSLEELEIESIVQDYLKIQADVKYLSKNEDLAEHTLARISEEKVQKIQKTVDQVQRLNSASPASEITVNPSFAEYMEDKARYIQYTRQAEGLNISNYSVTYGVPEIEIGDGVAKARIFETVGMQYDGLDEMSAMSTKYELDLARIDNEWIIVNIRSNDLFDQTHSQDDFDFETAVSKYDAVMADSGEVVVELDTTEKVKELKASGATLYAYNYASAANYSLTYTTSTNVNTTSYYNSHFPNHEENGDCMNFASQCMYAGFGGSDEVSAINAMSFPMDRQGNSDLDKWYTNASGRSSSAPWRGTLSFQNYASRVDGTVPSQDNMYVNMYLMSPSAALNTIPTYQTRLRGAVVFVLDDVGDLGHAMVISKVTGPSVSQVFVSAHTQDVKLVPLSQWISSSSYRIVIPNYYYSYSNAPALRVVTKWHDAQKVNTTLNLSAEITRKSGGTVFRSAMSVETPSGQIVWLGDVLNSNYYSKNYQFTQKGLYHITTYARETSTSANSVSNAIAVRIY